MKTLALWLGILLLVGFAAILFVGTVLMCGLVPAIGVWIVSLLLTGMVFGGIVLISYATMEKKNG